MTTVTHWIGGAEWNGTAERQGDVYDPATGEVTKQVDFASGEVMAEAVAAAKHAFDTEWGKSTLTKRMQVMFNFRELLNSHVQAPRKVTTGWSHHQITSYLW